MANPTHFGVVNAAFQAQTKAQFRVGEALKDLTQMPGWQPLLKLLSEQVETAKHRLLSSKLDDPTAIYTLRCRYIAMVDMLRHFDSDLDQAIQQAASMASQFEFER